MMQSLLITKWTGAPSLRELRAAWPASSSSTVVRTNISRALSSSRLADPDGWPADIGEKGMQRGHDLRAFANGSGDPLGRTRANIPNCENAAAACFQWTPIGASIHT